MEREFLSLKRICLIVACLLLLGAMLPFDVVDHTLLWIGNALGDTSGLDGLALLAPLATAFVLLIARVRSDSKRNLALGCLVLLLLNWLLAHWASLVSHPVLVYERLGDGLPDLFGPTLWLLLLALVVLGIGLRLASWRLNQALGLLIQPTRWVRWLTICGSLLLLVFYLVPHRGSLPLLRLVGDLGQLFAPGNEFQRLALLSGYLLSLGPLILGLLSVLSLFYRVSRFRSTLLAFVVLFMPGLCLVLGLRHLVTESMSWSVYLRSFALMLAIMLGAIWAGAALLRAIWFDIPVAEKGLAGLDWHIANSLLPEGVSKRKFLLNLDPLVRVFARRRWVLWQTVLLAGSSETGIQVLFRNPSIGDESSNLPGLPVWMRKPFTCLTILAVLVLIGAIELQLTHKPTFGQSWHLSAPDKLMHKVFHVSLPAVMKEHSQQPALDNIAAYRNLQRDLSQLDRRVPGISKTLNRLLAAGQLGVIRMQSIRRYTEKLNRLLQANRVPYYVHGRFQKASLGQHVQFRLLTYRIQATSRYRLRATSQTFLVLELVRADNLAIFENYMGVTEAGESFVTVFLDRIAYFIKQRIHQVVQRHDALGKGAYRALFALHINSDDILSSQPNRLGRLLTEALVRHELHHRWMGVNPQPPQVLWRSMQDYDQQSVRAVTAEIGAYLSEMAYLPAYARLRLALMLDALEHKSGRLGSHGLARGYLLKRLLDLQHADPEKLLGEVGRIADRLHQLDDSELSQRIQKLHQDLFGTPVPVFELIDKDQAQWDALP